MPGEDPLARNAALALGAARAGLGLGVLFFTEPTLKAMQFGEADATARSIAKLLGGRDLTLGLATLAARNSPTTLRQLTLTATLLDAADAVALSLASRDPDSRPAAPGGALMGAGAALAGAWTLRRLTP